MPKGKKRGIKKIVGNLSCTVALNSLCASRSLLPLKLFTHFYISDIFEEAKSSLNPNGLQKQNLSDGVIIYMSANFESEHNRTSMYACAPSAFFIFVFKILKGFGTL